MYTEYINKYINIYIYIGFWPTLVTIQAVAPPKHTYTYLATYLGCTYLLRMHIPYYLLRMHTYTYLRIPPRGRCWVGGC